MSPAAEFRLTKGSMVSACRTILAGWFRKFKGGRFLLFVTDRSKSVVIPTEENFTLIVSPDDTEAFLKKVLGEA